MGSLHTFRTLSRHSRLAAGGMVCSDRLSFSCASHWRFQCCCYPGRMAAISAFTCNSVSTGPPIFCRCCWSWRQLGVRSGAAAAATHRWQRWKPSSEGCQAVFGQTSGGLCSNCLQRLITITAAAACSFIPGTTGSHLTLAAPPACRALVRLVAWRRSGSRLLLHGGMGNLEQPGGLLPPDFPGGSQAVSQVR